jgi:hypothetical protein
VQQLSSQLAAAAAGAAQQQHCQLQLEQELVAAAAAAAAAAAEREAGRWQSHAALLEQVTSRASRAMVAGLTLAGLA